MFALRVAAGLTQHQLAKRAGIAQGTLGDIERGAGVQIRGKTLLSLATALQTNPDWLTSGANTPAKPVDPSIEESELLTIYRALPPALRTALLSLGRDLLASVPAAPSAVRPYPPVKA